MYGLVFCIVDTMQWCIVVDVSIYKTNDVHNKVKDFLKSHFTDLHCGVVLALLKVRQFQNEFMKSSFLPKYERKIVRISSLTKGQ